VELAVWIIVVASLVGPVVVAAGLLVHWVWSSENWTQPVLWRAPTAEDIRTGRFVDDPGVRLTD
jgi:hypothetical protein